MSIDSSKLPAVVNQGLSILTKLNPPPQKDEELGHCMANISRETAKGQKKPQPALQAHQHRQAFTECWLAFMRQPLSDEVYKQILLMIHKRIIPYMTQATLLIDFLTDSYDAGMYFVFLCVI